MKTQDLFEGFAYPKTNLQEVLLTLILQGNVSLFAFPVMAGFRTRVSNLVLNYGLNLETTKEKRCNKFGNSYTYHIHKLPTDQKDKAIEIYNKMVTR
jgi:hypothetical protein